MWARFNFAIAQGSFIFSGREFAVPTSRLCRCQGPRALLCSRRSTQSAQQGEPNALIVIWMRNELQ